MHFVNQSIQRHLARLTNTELVKLHEELLDDFKGSEMLCIVWREIEIRGYAQGDLTS